MGGERARAVAALSRDRDGAVVRVDRDAVAVAQSLPGGAADVGVDVRVRLERLHLGVTCVVRMSQARPPFVRKNGWIILDNSPEHKDTTTFCENCQRSVTCV